MSSNTQTLPGAFPLHADKNFLNESEWVILKLLCRPVDSLIDDDPAALSLATGKQISPARCDELIRIVKIKTLPGLGSWISRLMAEADLDPHALMSLPAETIVERINRHLGYPICNQATSHALQNLQLQWKGAGIQA